MRNFLGGLIIGLLFAAVVEQEERITELEVQAKLTLNSIYGKTIHATIYHTHAVHGEDNTSLGILDPEGGFNA